MNEPETKTHGSLNLKSLLQPQGPVSLVIKAEMKTVGAQDTFQPAGFPQIGHVIYKAPRRNDDGEWSEESVCVVDSAASMANHLESVCFIDVGGNSIHPDLQGLPYVICETDNGGQRRTVTNSLQEGHRLASDYFVDKDHAMLGDRKFRHILREEFGIQEVQQDKTYYVYPENWWNILSTIFQYDPNSLVHGVLFAREQIKISRLISPHLEAYGAGRVRGSGVKFDRLRKTLSGQPIFSTDSETARLICATFIIDLALLRSYGNDGNGLDNNQKRFLLEFSLWKINQLLAKPFRFRSECFLQCSEITISDENGSYDNELPALDIQAAIAACNFGDNRDDIITHVYYPSNVLFKVGEGDETGTVGSNENTEEDADTGDE